MGQFPQYGENGQNGLIFFNFSQQFWRDFARKILKNAFVLVLAHLEPELEMFEVDDIGDDDDDL